MRFYAVSAVLVLAACAPTAGDSEQGASAALTPGAPLPTSPTPTRADVCSERRQVGINPRPGRPCPRPMDSRWRSVNLFPHAGYFSKLRDYCVYDWTEETSRPRTDRLPGGYAPWLESDCEVVAVYGHPYGDRNAGLLESAFIDQMETVPTPPSAHPASKVIVVDTAVDGRFPTGASGRHDHGQAIASIIRKLACAGGPCLATVATQLALPLVRIPRGLRMDPVNGGDFGRPTDVAAAVHRGLHFALAAPGGNRIVINLSLGWEGRWGGPISHTGVSGLPAPIQLVYWAITEARCEGAVVITAAGNAPGGPNPGSGAAYPGGWESEPAPIAPVCMAAFGGGPPPVGTATYLPFVYAAGGVDGKDTPLMTEREEGRARLLGPSDHVAVSDGHGYVSQVYTGSSIGAAVASAMAAMTWTYRPGLSGDEVMALVYDASVDLSLPADICLDRPCTNARRMSLCRTVEQACVWPACMGAVACGPPNPGRDARVAGFDVSQPVAMSATATGTQSHMPPSPCSVTVYGEDPTTLDNPCPFSQYESTYTVRFAGPQPSPTPCPYCLMKDGMVYIGIDTEAGAPVSDPVVTIVTTLGDKKAFSLDDIGPLNPGDTIEVELDSQLAGDVSEAVIEFVQDGAGTQDVLIVE